jgi:hypothetical protein
LRKFISCESINSGRWKWLEPTSTVGYARRWFSRIFERRHIGDVWRLGSIWRFGRKRRILRRRWLKRRWWNGARC